jgi:DME family drug/metabolite transporter
MADAAPAASPATTRFPLPTWLALGLAALGLAAYQPSFFGAIQFNGVAIGTVVALATGPLVAGALDWAVRRARPGLPWLAATVLTIVGIGLLGGGSGAVRPLGLLLSAAAGSAYAVEAVFMKVALDRGVESFDAMSWVAGLAALGLVPLLIASGPGWLASPRGLAVTGWLAVVTVVIAFLCLAVAMKELPAATVTTLSMAEPAVATVLGVVALHERLTPAGLAGLAAIAAGLAILARSARREAPAQEAVLPEETRREH